MGEEESGNVMCASGLRHTAHRWARCAQLSGLVGWATQTAQCDPTEEWNGRRGLCLAHVFLLRFLSGVERKQLRAFPTKERKQTGFSKLVSPQPTGSKRLTKLPCSSQRFPQPASSQFSQLKHKKSWLEQASQLYQSCSKERRILLTISAKKM